MDKIAVEKNWNKLWKESAVQIRQDTVATA